MRLVTAIGALASLLAAHPGSAADVTIQDIDRGWYDSRGFTELPNQNYLAGECTEDGCGFPFAEYRNFFLFDLSSIDARIIRASLRLWVPEDGFVSPTGTETYQLFHVDTSPHEVGQRWGVDIFDDLGSGTTYGAYAAEEADEHTLVQITLNEAALLDLNAASDWLAFGGAVTTLDPEMNDELIFGRSGYQHAYLLLETVPLPGAAWLLASAMLVLTRRRSAGD